MTPDTHVDTLTVTEEHHEQVRSAGADVRLRVCERSLGNATSGRMAALRARLLATGLDEGAVMLEELSRDAWAWVAVALGVPVSIAVALLTRELALAAAVGGAFVALYAVLAGLKVGTVSATLTVRCPDAQRVSQALDAALALGHVEPQGILWRYEVDEASRRDWTARAVGRAHRRAAHLASSLGVRLVALHSLHETPTSPQEAQAAPLAGPPPVARCSKRRVTVTESVEPLASNTERAGVTVTVVFRVEGVPGLEAGEAP